MHHHGRLSGGRNMTEGNPYGHIVSFAMPLLVSQIFQQLYNTADTFIVGKYLGTDALAAVSSSGPLIFMMISFFMGTAQGAGVVISRYFGANDPNRVSRAIHTNIAFGVVVGILLSVVGVFFTPTLLGWMDTDPDIMPEAIEYFRYYYSGVITVVLYNILRGILNAVGDSRRPLIYLICSSLLNIALDFLFVGVFGWGVWSAAVATVISQAFSVVLCLIHLLKKGHIYSVSLRRIRFHWDMLKEILKQGLPAGVQNSVISIANVLVQTYINGFGKIATAAYGVHSKIEGFAFLPITSFNMAITTFISQNLGASKYDRAKIGARFGIVCGVAMAAVIGVLEYVLAEPLIGMFDKTPEVVELGARQTHVVALFYFLLAYSHSVAAVCRGAGRAIVPMLVMLAVWCVGRIIYIVTVMHYFNDITYVYWAYPLTWTVSSIIYFIYYMCSDWVHGFDKKSKIESKKEKIL